MVCIASGRELNDYHYWKCNVCKHCAYENELAASKTCPLCHSEAQIPSVTQNGPQHSVIKSTATVNLNKKPAATGDSALDDAIENCKEKKAARRAKKRTITDADY